MNSPLQNWHGAKQKTESEKIGKNWNFLHIPQMFPNSENGKGILKTETEYVISNGTQLQHIFGILT